ncbi:MAG: hypothetical protein E6Q97_32950 [Desulfurellales bacterium]|nr:MAG: hypothetical protein E6Q97_32950 [Desulfurellales bacterium]
MSFYEISDYLSDAYEAGAHFGFAEAVRMLRHKSFSETADGERNYMEGAWMRACADWLEKTVSEK